MESLLDFLTLLSQLLSTVVVIVLFFAFVIRPLLKYLFVNHEIEQHKKQIEETMLDDAAAELREGRPADEDTVSRGTMYQGASPSADRETLDRLATSDPVKAGDLVKKWIRS